ncbi:MAG: tRNA (guanosine(37)-N1)-methyltransferase TrmD [Lachnospiraceae bacterium]|nr:tRNA (guanosine(37)-N1)-methyltransferase TrmD [Lachnospiraceae bacterium]
MNYYVLSLFPEIIENSLNASITGRAIEKEIITLTSVDIRDFSDNKHMKVDDYPYGGGAGLVIKPTCVYDAYLHTLSLIKNKKKPRVVYMTPQGSVFNQKKAADFAKEEDLIILCGHYEGIDERVLETIVTDYVSIGDYVLTGGEIASVIVMDAVSRLVPGVLGNSESAFTDTFSDGLLEYPQYTRPEEFLGMKVPEVLRSGHHGNVEKWRHEQKLIRTRKNRPDLYEKYIMLHPEEELKD